MVSRQEEEKEHAHHHEGDADPEDDPPAEGGTLARLCVGMCHDGSCGCVITSSVRMPTPTIGENP